MTTISISEYTKKRLLIVAGELQSKLGKKVDFNDVINHLLNLYENSKRSPELFKRFATPIKGVSFKELYDELIRERELDEERTQGKYQIRP